MQGISSNTTQQTIKTAEQNKHPILNKESNEGMQPDVANQTQQQQSIQKQENQPYEKFVDKTGIGSIFNTKG